MDKKSILVVEDEQIIALDLQQCLEEMGYGVIGIADNGPEAIALAKESSPDVVLMDIMIKGDMNGTQAGADIGALGIPVIYLTAYSDNETVQRAAESAPYGFLTKPYQRRELVATIEVAMYKTQMERKLRESERWLAATLRCVGDAIIAADTQGRISFLNPAAEILTGFSSSEARGRRLEEVLKLRPLTAATAHRTVGIWQALRENRLIGIEQDNCLISRYGHETPVDYSAAPISDGDTALGSVVMLRDVSQRMLYEQRLQASEQHFRQIFECSPVGMALLSIRGQFLSVNAAFARLLGYSRQELLHLDQALISNQDDLSWEQDFLTDLTEKRSHSVQFEKRYQHRDQAHTIWALVNVTILQYPGQPQRFLYQIHDMTKRKQSEIRLHQLAHIDPLTELGNRAHLQDEMQRIFTYARRYRERFAVAYLDLDGFKEVNDGLGHDAGDEVLRTVARRLKAAVRESDCLARMGGDEFVIIFHRAQDRQHILGVMEKLCQNIAEPIHFEDKACAVTASYGVGLYPEDGDSTETLLRQADRGLLSAKAARRHLPTHRQGC